MRFLPILVLLLSSIPQLSLARIGETIGECELRYGPATGRISADEIPFYRSHVVIVVHLRAGRSIREDFGPESGGILSEEQIADFLGQNSEGSTWEISGETPTYTTYLRKDLRAIAQVAKPNTSGEGNIKLTVAGAELIVKYTSTAARELAAPR
ncbi:MAG: hypothetical protein M3R59_07825 [Verrucomicrobiota bacterium]|nr:hypothetical protein [Verrucomicrobiota bacterium]